MVALAEKVGKESLGVQLFKKLNTYLGSRVVHFEDVGKLGVC